MENDSGPRRLGRCLKHSDSLTVRKAIGNCANHVGPAISSVPLKPITPLAPDFGPMGGPRPAFFPAEWPERLRRRIA